MSKFYVQSGDLQLVIMAVDAEEAAIKTVQLSCDQRDTLHLNDSLENAQYPQSDALELHDDIFISEKGFGTRDAQRFDTLETVAICQGYAFPWDDSESPSLQADQLCP